MRRTTFRAAATCLFIFFTNALVTAQTRPAPPRTRQTATTAQPSGTTANEDFELNIAERHINETDFHAETAVEAGDETARGLNLKVGVAVGAREIDVLLRNVRGHVRFRATLEPVLRLLGARRGSQQTTTPAPPETPPAKFPELSP